MVFFLQLNKKVYCSNVGHSFHPLFRPELPVPRLLGMSLFVVSVERRHVALEVLLQLVEGAHCLIECPQRKRGKKITHVSSAAAGMSAGKPQSTNFNFD